MFVSLISHLLSAWFAFLLPCFSTFKALSRLPQSEADVQKWGMYWCIIGAFVAFEYLAEWFISWFPFYWECKTLFLLYLSLPQTQGSTFIYQTYLSPFLAKNEAALDEGIVSIQRNALAFLQEKLTALFNLLAGSLNRASANGQQAPANNAPAPPLQVIVSLWQNYGQAALSALHPATASASGANPNPNAALEHRSQNTPRESPASPPFPVPQHSS